MQKEELTRKLNEIIEHNSEFTTWTVSTPHLLMLVNEAVREEREACAKVADEFDPEMKMSNYGQVIANKIRARRQQ